MKTANGSLLLQWLDKNREHFILVSGFIYTMENIFIFSTQPSFRRTTSSKVDYIHEV